MTSALHDFCIEQFEGKDVFEVAGALIMTALGFVASSVPPHEQDRLFAVLVARMHKQWPKARAIFHHHGG